MTGFFLNFNHLELLKAHQAVILNTGGNMCSFRRGVGTQQGTITVHAIIRVGC